MARGKAGIESLARGMNGWYIPRALDGDVLRPFVFLLPVSSNQS